MIEVEIDTGLTVQVDDCETVREVVIGGGLVVEFSEMGPQGPAGAGSVTPGIISGGTPSTSFSRILSGGDPSSSYSKTISGGVP